MENIKKVSSSTRVKEKTRKVNSNRKKTDKIDEESVDDVNKSKDFSKKQKTNHTNDDVNVASKAKVKRMQPNENFIFFSIFRDLIEHHQLYFQSNDDQIKILPDLSFESSEDDDKNDDNDDNVAILLASSGCEENVIKTSNEIKKRNKFSWVKQKVTKDLDEAVDSIVAEGFKLYDDHDLKCGQKFYFRCGKIPKSRKTWCNKRYVVFLPSHNDDVEILWNGHECNHNELLKGQKRPVSEEMTTFIHDFYKEGNTMPSAVLAHIRIAREKFNLFKDEPDPDRRQLEYIHKKYIGKHVKPMINIGDLMEWCEKHSQFPADPNEAFILGYESCSMKEKMSFRFTMTTPNLLKKLAKRETICIDATYKLNWMGFPLIIMGTVDRAKRFHPLIYACSSHERTEDYDFVFRSVKDGIRVHLKKHFNPKTLIADGADAIRNGFYDVFPNAKLDIMCFAHVLRNIRKRPFASKNNKSLIIDDIRKMQLAPNRKVFDYMAMLFCDKWSPLEFNFVQYFKQQWLGSHSNWFEGAAEYTPSTNNALESHNAVIKRKITFRKRLPLNQFLKAMQEMTEDISKQLSNEERIIEEEPTIKKETWTKAARMHMENFKSFKAKDNRDDKETYVVPSSKCEIEDANEKYYKCLVKRQWKSFDEFISFGFQQFWIVQLSIADWKFESKCTCPIFFKHYMCKHVIAIAVKEKVAEFPDLANPVLLAPKRKAGRIAKSKRALEYQQ